MSFASDNFVFFISCANKIAKLTAMSTRNISKYYESNTPAFKYDDDDVDLNTYDN